MNTASIKSIDKIGQANLDLNAREESMQEKAIELGLVYQSVTGPATEINDDK